MRVVHLCHLPLSPDHPDHGRLHFHPGRWVLNLALAQKAHTLLEPHLVVQTPGASTDHDTEVEGIPVHFTRIPGRWRAATLFERDRRLLARRVNALRPDIVHAHGTEESYGLAAQTTGCPYLISAQGVYAVINRIMPPPWISRARLIEWLEHRCLRRARHVIAKSDYIAAELARLFPHLILHRIPNTYDPQLAGPLMEKEPRSIAFVGMGLSPRKGLHLLAGALEHPELDGVSLHIVGNRDGHMTPYESDTLHRLRKKLGPRLHLHGILSARQTAGIIARCQLLAAPSLEEMFGNQVVEAFLGGTWPVVSSGTAMEENIRRFGAGNIFTNGDVADLARALVLGLGSVRTWDPSATRDRLDAHMSPSVVARAHEELYRQILASFIPKPCP